METNRGKVLKYGSLVSSLKIRGTFKYLYAKRDYMKMGYARRIIGAFNLTFTLK
jgi:hypothetical protein